jgi:hypothetical protein
MAWTRRRVFGAVSVDGKRKKGRQFTEEEEAKAREVIAKMTDAERQALQTAAVRSLLKSTKVKLGEKKVGEESLAHGPCFLILDGCAGDGSPNLLPQLSEELTVLWDRRPTC